MDKSFVDDLAQFGGPTSLPSTAAEQTRAAATPETSPEQRGEVQRKLGRCMLRMQQYEMLTKAMLADYEQSGTMENWQARRQERVDKFARKSLGQLLEVMKESYLTPGIDGEQRAQAEPPEGLKQIWFTYRSSMQIDPGGYTRTIAAMQKLVDLRNDLVHHLLEHFNLWTLQGCAAADVHLERSYEVVDRHVVQLSEWARHIDEAKGVHLQFLQSDEFLDFLLAKPADAAPGLDGLAPVKERLQEAEAFLAVGGWTLLDDAIAFIGRLDKDESPSRYECKNWRQVLNKSNAFEYQRVALPERSGLYTVFRSKMR
jgi:hypothetical protein